MTPDDEKQFAVLRIMASIGEALDDAEELMRDLGYNDTDVHEFCDQTYRRIKEFLDDL